MVIRGGGVGRHRSVAVASSSSAYRSTGSKSVTTTQTRSTKLVRVTQTGLKKSRRTAKSKSDAERSTAKSILKKKGGGLLRRNQDPKIAHSVTFKDEDVSTSRNGDNSTIASEGSYCSAESSESGSTKSISSRVRSPPRRQPTLEPIEEGGETQSERDPPEPDSEPSAGGDAFFSLGAIPAMNGWSPPGLSLPSFHDATRNMNSWIMNSSYKQAGTETVPRIVPCTGAAAVASTTSSYDMNSPTNAAASAVILASVPSSTSSLGLNMNSENEAVAAPAPEEDTRNTTPNLLPLGKPPLHPSSTPSRCPPSPTESFVTPAEPKYGNFQDESSLQESIEVSEATPKAGNAIHYHSNSGISISSSSGASDVTPRIGGTPMVIEVPSIVISNDSNNDGGEVEEVESNSPSLPSLGGSSTGSTLSNASNQNLQRSSPSAEKEPEQNPAAYPDENFPATIENIPSGTQRSKTSVSGESSLASSSSVEINFPSSTSSSNASLSATESVNIEKYDEARALNEDRTKLTSSQPNAKEARSIASPRYTMELIEEMDKPSRPNHHKRSISLPKYFDRIRQCETPAASGAKAGSKPTGKAAISSSSAQIGDKNASEKVAEIIKEAKEKAAEPVINIHVHLNNNEVRAVANGTNNDASTIAEAKIPSETEVADSLADKAGSKEEETGVLSKTLVSDGLSSAEHTELDHTSVQQQEETEVTVIEIKESLDMDMDELALLSTTQCIMECRDPLSSKNPEPVIKKHHREPRNGASCTTVLSNKAAQCIRYCAESNDDDGEARGCQVFTNLFSCANEDNAFVDVDWDTVGSNESTIEQRSRPPKKSKSKKKKKRKPSRETKEGEEIEPVVFDSGSVSFRLSVDLPGSDQNSNHELSHGGDAICDIRGEHGSRDSDWEQDTIVMRRHDSSSIDSEAEDGKNRVTRRSKEKHRHRHRHRHSKKSRSSSGHPSRRSGSRSERDKSPSRSGSRSRSKSSTRSRSRSRSRSKRDQYPSRSRSRSRSRSKSSGAKKERRMKDNSNAHHRHGRHAQEEDSHIKQAPQSRQTAPRDERPLSPKKKRSMKDRLRERSNSRR